MFKSKKEACTADQELRMVKLIDWNDIEAYLKTFESLMSTYSIAKDGRIFKLVPQVLDVVQFVRTNFQDGSNQGGYKAPMMVMRAGARKQEMEE